MKSEGSLLVLASIFAVALALPGPAACLVERDWYTTTCWRTTTQWHTSTTCPKPTTATVTDTKTITKSIVDTTTVTTTHTKTEVSKASCTSTPLPVPTQACLVTNPLCTATGWKVDYYANPFAGYGYAPSGLGPGYYISEHLKPLGSATTEVTYFAQNTPPTGDPIVYPGTTFDDGQAPYYVGWTIDVAGITIDANNFTLVYSGLYRAPATGDFSLCSEADNIVDVFFGAEGGAFPCGGSPSASATPSVSGGVATGGNYNNPSTCFTESLTEGFYYPIRFVMANFQGPSALGFTITPPGGSASYDFTGLIFPAKCALL